MHHVKAFACLGCRTGSVRFFHDALLNTISFAISLHSVLLFIVCLFLEGNLHEGRDFCLFSFLRCLRHQGQCLARREPHPWTTVGSIPDVPSCSPTRTVPFHSCVTNEETEAQKCKLSKATQLVSDRAPRYQAVLPPFQKNERRSTSLKTFLGLL